MVWTKRGRQRPHYHSSGGAENESTRTSSTADQLLKGKRKNAFVGELKKKKRKKEKKPQAIVCIREGTYLQEIAAVEEIISARTQKTRKMCFF